LKHFVDGDRHIFPQINASYLEKYHYCNHGTVLELQVITTIWF